MTFPALLFFLYVVLLALALASGSWVAHLRPAPSEAQRVTDAVERAGANQLGGSLVPALVCVGFVCAQALILSRVLDLAPLWLVASPVLGALCAGIVALAASRRLIRVAGQMVDAKTADTITSLSGRAAFSATLVTLASAGGLVTGLQVLTAPALGASGSLMAGLLATTSGGLVLVLFGRTLSIAWATAEAGSVGDTLSSATLARLVGASFGAPVIRAGALFTAVGLSHLGLARLGLEQAGLRPGAGQFLQMLVPLGLVASCFGAVAIRSSEREPAHFAWLRGGLVSLLVLLAGIWSLASHIETDAGRRLLPTALTFLLIGAGAVAFFTAFSRSPTWRREEPRGDTSRAGLGALGLLSLPLLLSLALPEELAAPALPGATFVGIVLAAALTLLPLVSVWQLAADTLHAARHCQLLAAEGLPTPASPLLEESLPRRGDTSLTSVALCVVAVCAVSLLSARTGGADAGSVWILGIAALLGALTLLETSAINHTQATRTARALLLLPGSESAADPTPSLGAALEVARSASAERRWVWLSALLGPPLALCLAQLAGGAVRTPHLAEGFFVGLLTCASVVGLLRDSWAGAQHRAEASLALPTALAMVAWSLSLLLSFPG